MTMAHSVGIRIGIRTIFSDKMNQIYYYGDISLHPMYNCGAHTPEEWTKLQGVCHPFIGTFELLYGIVINILYVPILIFMLRPDYFSMSCFKIMAFLGIADMLAISINAIIQGYLSIHGAVFCTNPNFIYISGALVTGFWCTSCFLAMLLVANRLLDITNPSAAKFLFGGYRIYISLFVPLVYGVFFILFTHPVLYNSRYLTWLFDPLVYEGRTLEYANIPHSMNNFFVVAGTFVVYTILYFTLWKTIREIQDSGDSNQTFSLQILMQSSIICLINMVASAVFVLMNSLPFPVWVFMITHKCWQFIHGAPMIIYLGLNKTIRKGFLQTLGFQAHSQIAPGIT